MQLKVFYRLTGKVGTRFYNNSCSIGNNHKLGILMTGLDQALTACLVVWNLFIKGNTFMSLFYKRECPSSNVSGICIGTYKFSQMHLRSNAPGDTGRRDALLML